MKAPFSDGEDEASEDAQVEQMWVSDVDFNGKLITGTLINSPQWVTSVAEGDEVRMPIGRITDWMYSVSDRVYGAYTVNLIRSRMSPDERAQHDEAWGLEFGDPKVIELVPPADVGSGDSSSTSVPGDPDADHPMDVNMSQSLAEHLEADPGTVHETDDAGWTYLHQLALAGSTNCVAVVLKHGADANAMTSHGMTPLQLANTLGWTGVSRLLAEHGAK